MVASSRSSLLAIAALAIVGCADTHHAPAANAANLPDATDASSIAATPDAAVVIAPAPDAGTVIAQGPDGQIPFIKIPIGAGETCAPFRAGVAIGSASRVLVTTGCAFYAVDTTRNAVERLAARGDSIAQDGPTVAVIADKLGLSIDGGQTFEWTDWSLGRCQGTPAVDAGDGIAVVTCVAGAGRWLGRGSAFEMLSPSGSGPLLPRAAAHGSHVIIHEEDGWFASADSGHTFQPLRIDGLPENLAEAGLLIVESQLFVWVRQQDGSPSPKTTLLSAQLGGGSFTAIDAFPKVMGEFSATYNDGGLVVLNGPRFLLSVDRGASFSEVKTDGFTTYGAVAKYAGGRVYIMTEGALYVGDVTPSIQTP